MYGGKRGVVLTDIADIAGERPAHDGVRIAVSPTEREPRARPLSAGSRVCAPLTGAGGVPAVMSMSGPPYDCPYCSASFETPPAKPSHLAAQANSVHPLWKLEALRALTDALGHVPTRSEMTEHGRVSGDALSYEFGSWNEAVRAAGLEPRNHRNVARETLLAAVEELADTLGHAPRADTWADRGEYHIETIREEFGSWTAAVRAAGYTPHQHIAVGVKVPRPALLTELQRLADELGRAPSASEFRARGKFAISTIRSRFASYESAVREADLTPYNPKAYAVETLLAALHSAAAVVDGPLTIDAMATHGAVSPSAVTARFGSWNQALRAAGLPIARERAVSDTALVRSVRRVANRLGHVPTWREGLDEARYAMATYQTRFGSWADTLAAAGLALPESDGDGEQPGYGPNWATQRARTLARDDYTCQVEGCAMTRERHQRVHGCDLHVHHQTPLVEFETDDGEIDYAAANDGSNLVTLCSVHHPQVEQRSLAAVNAEADAGDDAE